MGLTRRFESHDVFRTTRNLFRASQAMQFDWVGPACILCLSLIGVAFIYSAHAFTGGDFWIKQLVWIVLGAGVYGVVSMIDYRFYMRNALWFYFAGLFLLLLIFTPLGLTREGATRWLNFVVLAYQPSEAAKVCTLIMVSTILATTRIGKISDSVRVLAIVFGLAGLPMFLIFLQPDLGSCLIIPPMVLALLYVSKLSIRFFLVGFALVVCMASILAFDLYSYAHALEKSGLSAQEFRGEYQSKSLVPLRDYQRERIMTFAAPEVVDPSGTGAAWNAIQAESAVGSGGLFGRGYANGQQARLGYLPRTVAHNDFIFAVFAEEQGFLGGMLVVGLFGVLLANGVRIAGQARDRFGMLLCVGVTVIFLIHVFVNIGMTIGLTPITGLPLPFVSYGGSFILSCCILQGIVQSVHRHHRLYE